MRKNTKRSIDRESEKKTQKNNDGVKIEDVVDAFDFANMVVRWLGRDRHWSLPIYFRDTLNELSRLIEEGRTVRGRNSLALLNAIDKTVPKIEISLLVKYIHFQHFYLFKNLLDFERLWKPNLLTYSKL